MTEDKRQAVLGTSENIIKLSALVHEETIANKIQDAERLAKQVVAEAEFIIKILQQELDRERLRRTVESNARSKE